MKIRDFEAREGDIMRIYFISKRRQRQIDEIFKFQRKSDRIKMRKFSRFYEFVRGQRSDEIPKIPRISDREKYRNPKDFQDFVRDQILKIFRISEISSIIFPLDEISKSREFIDFVQARII